MEIETTYSPCLHKEYRHTSPEDIERMYSEAIDRWTWETGSDEDWALVQKLDTERYYRKNTKSRKLQARWTVEDQEYLQTEIGEGVEEELIDAIAKEIADEQDKDIMRFLK